MESSSLSEAAFIMLLSIWCQTTTRRLRQRLCPTCASPSNTSQCIVDSGAEQRRYQIIRVELGFVVATLFSARYPQEHEVNSIARDASSLNCRPVAAASSGLW